MSIKQTKFTQIENSFNNAKKEIQSILNMRDLPKEIINEIKKTQTFLEQYDITKHNTEALKTLTGKILTADEIKNIVIDASGYKKWTIEEMGADDLDTPEMMAKNFGVDVAQPIGYMVTRDVNSRDRLEMLIFTCMPGYADVELQTGRVGYGLEGLVKNTDILKRLEAEFDNE